MKINLDKQLQNLAGKSFDGDDNHMGKVLAHALSMGNKGNSIKLYDWALKLYNKQELEIDDTDFQVLKGLVETTELLNVLCKAQILNALK